MITARGWWLLIGSTTLAFVGTVWLGQFSATIPLIGLTLLSWFFWEWIQFHYRFTRQRNQLRLERVLLQGGREIPTAWAGATVTVRLTLTHCGDSHWPLVVFSDDVPREWASTIPSLGTPRRLDAGQTIMIEYQLLPQVPGLLRFEGVDVRVSDLAGLFYSRWFLRQPVEYLVLPPLTDDEGHTRGVKRFNCLPPPGVHRLRRPGSGSELLDLRDYRPGDPPKMIAWKASARRDRLITKEFESDVPLRCVLFLDNSNSVHVGPEHQQPIIKLGSVAAALAQAAAANRDLIGLTLFDDLQSERLAPARTRPHLIQILRKIGLAIGQLPRVPQHDADLLARYAYPVAQQYYPELLSKDLNSRPLGLFWLPIADTRWFWLLLAFFFSPLLLIRPEARELLAQIVLTFTSQNWSVSLRLVLVVMLLSLPLTLTGLLWFFHGIRGLLQPRAGRTSRRKQLAAVFTAVDQSSPMMMERYLRDDRAFVDRATAFLSKHRVPLPLILTKSNGEDQFHEPRKLEVLAKALARAVAVARDNEQYVLLIDLMNLLPEDLEPLIPAIRMARARHHQVIVLLSWPADIPGPSDEELLIPEEPVKLNQLVRTALINRYHRHFREMRAQIVRVGATVLRVDQSDAIPLVLERLEQLRAVRVRR